MCNSLAWSPQMEGVHCAPNSTPFLIVFFTVGKRSWQAGFHHKMGGCGPMWQGGIEGFRVLGFSVLYPNRKTIFGVSVRTVRTSEKTPAHKKKKWQFLGGVCALVDNEGGPWTQSEMGQESGREAGTGPFSRGEQTIKETRHGRHLGGKIRALTCLEGLPASCRPSSQQGEKQFLLYVVPLGQAPFLLHCASFAWQLGVVDLFLSKPTVD